MWHAFRTVATACWDRAAVLGLPFVGPFADLPLEFGNCASCRCFQLRLALWPEGPPGDSPGQGRRPPPWATMKKIPDLKGRKEQPLPPIEYG
jgi:hypothetical protein